jgi:superfamily II DNA or RNA helicase
MPVQILIREGSGYLSGLPDELAEPLKLATSFRPAGYQYTKLFKSGRSDGRVKLLKHSRFPAGLLTRVTTVLDRADVPYHIDSEAAADTKPEISVYTIDLQERWYQDAAVEAAILHPRGIVRARTGSGKTAVIARVIAARAKRALVIVPTIDLLYQTKTFLEEHLYDHSTESDPTGGAGWGQCVVGQLGDGVVQPQEITVATARTAAKVLGVAYESYEFGEYDDSDDTQVDPKSLREFVEGIGTLIVDEAHILGAQTIYDVASKVPAPNKYGFSASPWRDDGADLMVEAATGPVIYRIGTEALVKGGFLVPPMIQTVDTAGWWKPAAWGEVCTRCGVQRGWETRPSGGLRKQLRCNCGNGTWRSEYTQAYAAEIVNNPIRNARIAEIVRSLDGATMVLVKQVKHGRIFQDLIPGAQFLSGKDKSAVRTGVLGAMRAGVVDVLVATTIADLGLDLPILKNLVLAAGGKSSTRHLQRIGRVARPYPGKDFARVIDFDDSHVHAWFKSHAKARRKVEKAEWDRTAIWL